jgi:glycosyltransferase involved in cell wall biosynthesis
MTPLISCICVTRDRRHFIGAAIDSFLSQDWPNKELVIVDDGNDAIADMCANVPNSRYTRLRGTHKIGSKRNLGCAVASGDIMVHWDDDDWSAPARLTDQAERLMGSGKAVTGYHTVLFTDGKCAYRYQGTERYAIGSSLCYLKTFWEAHHFIDENQRMWEDNRFVHEARTCREMASADARAMMVCRIHSGNTCPKRPADTPKQWAPLDLAELPELYFETLRRRTA